MASPPLFLTMIYSLLGFEPKPQRFHKWGPCRNRWGYTITIGQFEEEDIWVRVVAPDDIESLYCFSSWEDCERLIILLEQDRRF